MYNGLYEFFSDRCFVSSSKKFVVKLKTTYMDDGVGKTQVFDWFSRFERGEILIDDNPCSGRPFAARIDKNVE